MGTIGTFGSYTQARLAIYASYMGLNVTGNNIANINTTGYTRQKLEQESFRTGGADRYHSAYSIRVGNGVLPTNVSQLRDPYLDIRYRSEMSSVGAMDAKLAGLEDIQAVLDEVGDGDEAFGIIEAQLSKLHGALQELSQETGQQEYDIQVRSAAEALAQQFNSYAAQLEEVYENAVHNYKQDVKGVNNILEQIQKLNATIRKNDIHGDNSLELRDERNLLIDQLSEYMKIDVKYEEENIGAGQTVEKLVIKLGNANPDASISSDETTLIDGIYARQLYYPLENPAYDENSVEPDNHPSHFKYMVEDTSTNPPTYTYTNDPAEATQKFDDNFSLLLGALEDVNGRPQRTYELQVTPSDTDFADKSDAGTVDNGDGTTTTVKYYDKTKTVTPAQAANVTSSITVPDDATWSLIAYTPSAIAAVAEAAGAADGASMTLEYNATDSKLHLMLNGTSIGSSDALTLPLTTDTQAIIQAADGSALAHVELAAGTADTDLAGMVTSGTMQFTAAQAAVTKTTYYREVLTTTYSTPVALDDNDLYGALQSQRELLTESGEFATAEALALDENASTKRGIPYYQKALDLLANQIATAFNEANQGFIRNEDGEYLDANGDPLVLPETTLTAGMALAADQQAYLEKNGVALYETDNNGNYVDTDGNVLELNGTTLTANTTLTADQQAHLESNGVVVGYKTDNNGNYVDANNAALVMPETTFTTDLELTADRQTYLEANGQALGKPLFSVRGDTDADVEADGTPITASNISISDSWSDGPQVVGSFVLPTGMDEIPSTASDNIEHMIYLFTKDMEYRPDTVDPNVANNEPMFTGSFQEMWVNIGTVLGNDMSTTTTMLDTYYASSVSLNTSRDSVSSVDLNDEAMNLMQYQKSYQAACRLMTTIDSVLDKLINGTGITV